MNIKVVAEKAGVSITTVSRVLNMPEKVNEKTKAKVIAVMEELNYTPNWFARNLQNSRTNLVGVLVPDNMEQSSMAVAKGIEKIALQKGSNMILCNTGYNVETEKEHMNTLIDRKIDGIVFVSSSLTEADVKYIKDKDVPFVFVDKCQASRNENVVYTNYDKACEEVVRYLADMGRKDIAFLIPNDQDSINRQKLKGYKEGITSSGLMCNEGIVVYADDSIEGGFAAANRIIQSDEKVDAIFAATDTIAFGAIEAMHQNELDSDRLGIVGFGGNQLGAIVEPKLTTVSKPSHRMGLTAGRLLFDLIDSKEEEEPQSIMIQSKLKIRKSCGNKERVLEIW